MKLGFIILAFIITTNSLADVFDHRLSGLVLNKVTEAKFTELWNAEYLEEPAKSSGHFTFYPSGKLVKTVIKPERAEYVIEDDLLTANRNGKKDFINLKNNEALSAGFDALRYLLMGKRDALEKKFVTHYRIEEDDPDNWNITLVPESEQIRERVNKIAVHIRHNKISELHISYGNGNELITHIYNHDK